MAEVDPKPSALLQDSGEGSALAPFRHRAFAVLWVATVVSNIGTWMQNAAAGWLMTSIDPDPLVVSLVQATASLPMFLFALPAGALADIVDRRRLLIVIQVVATTLVAAFGFAVWLGRVSVDRSWPSRFSPQPPPRSSRRPGRRSCPSSFRENPCSLSIAHLLAALGCAAAVPLLWPWKLQTGAALDLTPSMHWPQPVLSADVATEGGPVLVTVQYRTRPDDREPFLAAIRRLAGERRRDGAFDWDVFEDLAAPGRFVETFMLDSWSEHLRQHARVTHADRALQELVNRFQVAGVPKVGHLIAAGLARPETIS